MLVGQSLPTHGDLLTYSHRATAAYLPLDPCGQKNTQSNIHATTSPQSMPPRRPPPALLLIKQIRPTTPQIHNLRTPIPILLQPRTLKAVERIADPLPPTHHTLVLIVAEGALVADARQGGGPHVRVADGAFAVAFVAEAADVDAGELAAHDEVGVVAGHGGSLVV